jgi:hypothetical protein
MIWLNIYVVTVLFCIVARILVSIEVNLLAKEQGVVSTRKRIKGRMVFTWVKTFIICLVPLWNIVVGCASMAYVFSEKVQKQTLEQLLAKGEVKYKDEG